MKLKQEDLQRGSKKGLPQEYYDWNLHDLPERIRDQMNRLEWIPLTLTEKSNSELLSELYQVLPQLTSFEFKPMKFLRENLILKMNGGVKPRHVGLQNDLKELWSVFVACVDRNWPQNGYESFFLGGLIGMVICILVADFVIGCVMFFNREFHLPSWLRVGYSLQSSFSCEM